MVPDDSPVRTQRKLRILCLHGYHGSGRALRSQMAALAEAIAPLAELVFLDAPSLAVDDFGWWHAVDVERDPARDDPGVDGPHRHYKGWERTRDAVVAFFASQGSFDGVLGFSQGAALAGLLVGLRAPDGKPTPERPLVFGFAIVVSGFPANDPELARLYDRTDAYRVPSLHVVGRSDGIVAPRSSLALASRFVEPRIVEHDHGHIVASDPHVVSAVRTFLDERRIPHAHTDGPLEVPLWPGLAAPTMRVVFPKDGSRAPRTALVVLRGGGYATSKGSGGGSAEWAAQNGLVGIEVTYRTKATGDAFPKPYADAARAVRIVRSRAAEWGIDPRRVGLLGYSAGGHLASLVSTQPALFLDPADELATSGSTATPRVDARPDFVLLAYPVISFVDGYAPGSLAGSAENFLGRRDLDDATRRTFSNELHVTSDHPPVFVWTTADDELVPAAHAERFAAACERASVPVRLRVYPHGAHGLGLGDGAAADVAGWPKEALTWLRSRGF